MDTVNGLVLLVISSFILHISNAITTTGGFSSVASGTLESPGYPSTYNASVNRIWVLQAPSLQGVELDISAVDGDEAPDGSCNDYVEVRDGSSSASLLFYSCATLTNTTVQSTNRWLWIKFYSDWEIENTGFQATWVHFDRANVNDTEYSPRPVCRGNEIRCPNTECVTMSWRCDGFNDCGYDGDGSDEDWWCFTQPMSVGVKYGVGISVGVVVFVLLILLVGWLDGRFTSAGRCGRGPKSCLGLDNLRQGPRTRRLPSYTGPETSPAMLLLTGQHEQFEELAAKEWEKKSDAYRRRASQIDILEVATLEVPSTPMQPMTKPNAVQQKGKQQLQRMRSAREQVPEVPVPRDVKRKERPRPWLKGAKEADAAKDKA